MSMSDPICLPLVEAAVAKDDDTKLVEIQIVPAGDKVDMRKAQGEGAGVVIMDREAFKVMEARFKARDRKIVIDWEHQTVGDSKRPDGLAPAAGWIKSIRFDPDLGVIASVEWNAKAREMIRSGEYSYLSPVVFIRKTDRRVVELHSAAVTNDPAVNGMLPLAAKRESAMPKKTKKTRKGAKAVLGDELYDKLVCQEDIDPEQIGEEVIEQVDPLADAIASLKAILMEAGVVDETAGPVDIVNAAIDKVKGGGEPAPAEATEAVEAVRKQLGLDDGANQAAIIAKLDTLVGDRVPAEEHAKLKTRLDELESTEADRKATVLVAKYVDTGQLNPNDKERMAWAHRKAVADAEDFIETMDPMPKVFDPERKVTRSEDQGPARDDRSRIIARADKEFSPDAAAGASRRGWVDGALDDTGQAPLTDTEHEALAK